MRTTGRGFGFVSTGVCAGSVLAPVLFGWIIDQGHPGWVFGLLGILTNGRPRHGTRPRTFTNCIKGLGERSAGAKKNSDVDGYDALRTHHERVDVYSGDQVLVARYQPL